MNKELVILTGASRGMGRAIAEELLDKGCDLITLQRSPSDELEVYAQASGAKLIQFAVDLRESKRGAEVMAQGLAASLENHSYETLTLLCNAGIGGPEGFSEDTDDDEFLETVSLMALSPMMMVRRFLRDTRDFAGRRRILCISSGNGRKPVVGLSAYGTAKSSLDRFCNCVAADEAVKDNPVAIVSLAPGIIDTDMQTHLRRATQLREEVKAKYVRYYEQGRLMTPKEAAQCILRYLERKDFGKRPIADVRDPD